jgi:Domain of unknown function (DUF397)
VIAGRRPPDEAVEVEVADNVPGVVGVRDSKDQAGPVLVFEPASWQAFVEFAKQH